MRSRKRQRVISLRATLLCAGIAAAHAPATFAQILPFHTSTAVSTGFEERAVRSFASRMHLSGLREDGERIPDPLAREMDVTAVPIAIPYAVHRDVVPIVMLPILDKRLRLDTPDGRRAITNTGIGDLTLLVKFAPLQWDAPGESRRIAFFTGVKFPSGSTDALDSGGEPLPAALQLGTGAYEFPLGASFSWSTPGRIGLVTDFFYNVNTTDDLSDGTDSFSYDAAIGWRASPSVYRTSREKVLNFYLELNGRHEIDAGDLVYVSPGVQFIPWLNFLAELSLQVPVHQDFAGVRPDIDYNIAGGLRWIFPF